MVSLWDLIRLMTWLPVGLPLLFAFATFGLQLFAFGLTFRPLLGFEPHRFLRSAALRAKCSRRPSAARC